MGQPAFISAGPLLDTDANLMRRDLENAVRAETKMATPPTARTRELRIFGIKVGHDLRNNRLSSEQIA